MGSTAEFSMESLSGRIFSTDPSRSDTQYRLAGFHYEKMERLWIMTDENCRDESLKKLCMFFIFTIQCLIYFGSNFSLGDVVLSLVYRFCELCLSATFTFYLYSETFHL